MSEQHYFYVSIAKKHGLNVATFLHNIAFWIKKNIANRSKFHKNTFWTRNTQPAFLELFPYWSSQNLKTIIKYCKDNDLILVDNFNDKKYDKTSWYALTEKGLKLFNELKDAHDYAVLEKNSNKINISYNQPMDKLELTDGEVRTNRPIPDINTDITTDIKNTCASEKKNNDDGLIRFKEFYDLYPKKVDKIDSKITWKKNKLDEKADLILCDLQKRIAKEWQFTPKKFIPSPARYLNKQLWTNEIINIEEGSSNHAATKKSKRDLLQERTNEHREAYFASLGKTQSVQ